MRIFSRLFMLLTAATSSWASSSEHHPINWWGMGAEFKDAPALGWLTLTFLIFIFALIKAVRKPLSLYLETRSNDIRKAIEEGQRARSEGEEKLKLFEEKLRGLDQEIENLKKTFREQAQAEKIEKERLAREASERIIKDTKDTIKASFERSKTRLAEEVIRTALAEAQKTIMENQRAPVDAHLKERLVAELKSAAKDVPL